MYAKKNQVVYRKIQTFRILVFNHLLCRGAGNRTQTKGFGDPYDTISPRPYALSIFYKYTTKNKFFNSSPFAKR